MIQTIYRPSVAAVVVTFNRKELLLECLRGLFAQTRHLDKVIIVDNASRDGTRELLRVHGLLDNPRVVYICLPSNMGGAGGFYEGLKWGFEAGFDWLWLMDDDAEPLPDALEALLASEPAARPDTLALSSTILDLKGTILISCNKVFDQATLQELPMPLVSYSWPYFEVELVTFISCLIRVEAIRRVGLPRREFFLYYDDTDYCLRLREEGKIYVVPRSRVIHKEQRKQSATVRRLGKERVLFSWRNYYEVRNRVFLLKQFPKHGKKELIIGCLVLRRAAAILLFADRKLLRLRLLWQAVLDGYKDRLGKTVEPGYL